MTMLALIKYPQHQIIVVKKRFSTLHFINVLYKIGNHPKMQDFSRINYQPNMNLDYITESIRQGTEERSGYANVMFKRLLEEIMEFESELKPDEEIGAYLASFAGGIYLHIESIKYRDPYYIVLSGTTDQGQQARLVQHVTQTCILFVPVQVTPEEGREPRRFGFTISSDKD